MVKTSVFYPSFDFPPKNYSFRFKLSDTDSFYNFDLDLSFTHITFYPTKDALMIHSTTSASTLQKKLCFIDERRDVGLKAMFGNEICFRSFVKISIFGGLYFIG